MRSETTSLVGIIGAGGFGREVMPIARANLSIANTSTKGGAYEMVFVEENPISNKVNNTKVLSIEDYLNASYKAKYFSIAIADSLVRERIAKVMLKHECQPFSIQSPSLTTYDENVIGEGAILCANTIITSNARIGRFFHANLNSYIAHDCVIGDYVTFAPNVHCNGNVHIEDHAYIGTGAIIKPGSSREPVIVGEGAVVGMGGVVTKSVPAHTTVVGNPAKPLGSRS